MQKEKKKERGGGRTYPETLCLNHADDAHHYDTVINMHFKKHGVGNESFNHPKLQLCKGQRRRTYPKKLPALPATSSSVMVIVRTESVHRAPARRYAEIQVRTQGHTTSRQSMVSYTITGTHKT